MNLREQFEKENPGISWDYTVQINGNDVQSNSIEYLEWLQKKLSDAQVEIKSISDDRDMWVNWYAEKEAKVDDLQSKNKELVDKSLLLSYLILKKPRSNMKLIRERAGELYEYLKSLNTK